MEADQGSPHINTAPYPVTDDDGYYMAYQDHYPIGICDTNSKRQKSLFLCQLSAISYRDGDTWINWWAKPKWSVLGVLSQFLFTKVRNDVAIFVNFRPIFMTRS